MLALACLPTKDLLCGQRQELRIRVWSAASDLYRFVPWRKRPQSCRPSPWGMEWRSRGVGLISLNGTQAPHQCSELHGAEHEDLNMGILFKNERALSTATLSWHPGFSFQPQFSHLQNGSGDTNFSQSCYGRGTGQEGVSCGALCCAHHSIGDTNFLPNAAGNDKSADSISGQRNKLRATKK